MKERILQNWHVYRIIYLAIGLFFCVYAMVNKDWTASLPGIYFASMAIFHFGCAAGRCYVAPIKKPMHAVEKTEADFEEIK